MSKTQETTEIKGTIAELRVAAGSDVGKLAGAIVKFMDEDRLVDLVGIGAGAVNQAIKAFAVASGMASPVGKILYCIPSFCDEKFEKEGIKTAIKVKIRDLAKLL